MALSHIKVEVTAGHEEQLSHFITVQMFFLILSTFSSGHSGAFMIQTAKQAFFYDD